MSLGGTANSDVAFPPPPPGVQLGTCEIPRVNLAMDEHPVWRGGEEDRSSSYHFLLLMSK